MLKQEIKIINKLGLHARASSKFTQTAAQFSSEVWVTRKDRRVNGKSIMGLMMLAATPGSSIQVTAAGPQALAALEALGGLIAAKFGEE